MAASLPTAAGRLLAQTSGVSANEKINLACVGIGNMGGRIARRIGASDLVNVVAVCDVDMGSEMTAETLERFPDARRFTDFRRMFDKMANRIDAVTIGTPDHSHFPIAMMAMALGKHIYVEKPLANTFYECQLLMAAEKKYNVVAQMGNQGHSGANYHQFKAWVEAGVIKDVTKVVAFMNSSRRWHGWTIDGYPQGEPIPETLDWDLWHAALGVKPFSRRYHPGNWRSWFHYGNGAIGDWAAHILDTAHRFLELGMPTKIEPVRLDGHNNYIFPQASTLRFDFPARGDKPPVEVFWYDGTDNQPDTPPELEGRTLRQSGKLIFSKDMTFYGGTHHETLRIIPESKRVQIQPDLPRFELGQSDHYDNFILAVKGQEQPRSPLAVAGPLTQMCCLGKIAQYTGKTLIFDPKSNQITNDYGGNALLWGPPPRKGWEQFYRL